MHLYAFPNVVEETVHGQEDQENGQASQSRHSNKSPEQEHRDCDLHWAGPHEPQIGHDIFDVLSIH